MFFFKDKTLAEYGLDATIVKALNAQDIEYPSQTQAQVLPLALDGQDVLVRAKTGSGKTFAFCLPLVQKVLKIGSRSGPLALILAPTRELCSQIEAVVISLLDFCEEKIDIFCVSGARHVKVEVPRLKEKPAILIGTPARICQHVNGGHLTLMNLQILCIDEADLILSFGYEDDMKFITKNLPQRSCQCILTSATLSDDILKLKTLLMHNPVVVKIETKSEEMKLAEFYALSEERDKFLLLFGLVKLKLVKGKVLIFVNSLTRCYKVKLFLEKFSVPVGVLNDQLPYNTRMKIINQFNSGVMDYLIATDTSVEIQEQAEKDEVNEFLEEENEEEESSSSSSEEEKEPEEVGAKRKLPQKSGTPRKKQKVNFGGSGYGVHRGVDFREVAAVVNFDFPLSEKNYTHRVGRTARGGNFGLAISLVNRNEKRQLDDLQATKKKNGGPDAEISVLNLQPSMLKAFNTRISMVFGQCSKKKIKEIRLREIEVEMLNSKHIRERFAGTRELDLLRHDKLLRRNEVDPHMGIIPKYLRDQLPFDVDDDDINYQTLTGSKVNPQKFNRKKQKKRKRKRRKRKGKDPLKSFGRR